MKIHPQLFALSFVHKQTYRQTNNHGPKHCLIKLWCWQLW